MNVSEKNVPLLLPPSAPKKNPPSTGIIEGLPMNFDVFVALCIELRGDASALDLHSTHFEIRRVRKMLKRFIEAQESSSFVQASNSPLGVAVDASLIDKCSL